jgi:phosphatidate cytidylyltransferase
VSSLALRVLTAAVLAPLVLAALFLLSPRGWAVVSLGFVLVAAEEWGRLVGYARPRSLQFVVSTLLIAGLLAWQSGDFMQNGFASSTIVAVCGMSTLFWIFAAPAWLRGGWSTRSPLPMACVGWLALLGVWVALVALHARSPWLVLAAMAVVWVADTAAYFAGRALGRHKLAPAISPGKTWEGAYGAFAAVAVYALVLAPFAPDAGYPRALTGLALVLFVLFMLALAAISIVGDLYESLLKRHAGVKDSGSLLPGHGGVLDRVDALLAAMPPAALAATLFLRPGGTP